MLASGERMPDIVWIDGVDVSSSDATLSLRDRSVSHGDSVFEVLRATGGRVFALEEHLGRLQRSAAIVGRVFPCSVGRLAAEVSAAVRASGYEHAHVRVLLTRGEGGDGLSLRGVKGGRRAIIVRARPALDESIYREGIRVCAIEHTISGIAAELARAKSGNYLAHVMALARAQQRGFDDALLVDDRERVWEASAANVFAMIDGTLVTPPDDGPILAGVTRWHLLDIARSNGLPVRERELQWTELLSADEVFLSSTIREVVSVVEVDEHAVGQAVPGRIATLLRSALQQRY